VKILGVLVAAVVIALAAVASFATQAHVSIVITHLDDQATSKGHHYLIAGRFADGHQEVFENTDAWLHGKTTSSNLQFSLHTGEHVNCLVNGFRNGLFSSYRNILSCTQAPAPAQQAGAR
jgi:hypothetical protein